MNWDSSALWGIISIIVTIILYELGNRCQKIVYAKQSEILITESISTINGLEITFHETPIKNLLYTTLKIKSAGKDTIEMKDFIDSAPLRIKTDGMFFIDDINSILLSKSRPSNHITFDLINRSTIQINFDTLKYKDLITIKLYHTGALEITGELRKGKIIYSNSINKKSISDIFTGIGIAIGILFIALASIKENGAGFYIGKALELICNMALGIFLIAFYQKYYKK